jgi:hypothetical protein
MYERVALDLPGLCIHYKHYCGDVYCTGPWTLRHPPPENMAELEYQSAVMAVQLRQRCWLKLSIAVEVWIATSR